MTLITGDWSASVDVLGQFFYILLIFAIVVLLFLICARFFGKVRIGGRGKNMRVLDSCAISPQCSVQVLLVGERLFLIGVTKDNINILAEITGQQIDSFDKEHLPLFDHYLKRHVPPEETEKKEDGT